MLWYVKSAVLKFQREATKTSQDAPHRWNQPIYSAKNQYADTDTGDLVHDQYTLYVQKVCRTFLYYCIAVDQTLLVALNTITTAQDHSHTTTMGEIIWLLNYAETHPDATLPYHASDIIPHVASNASHLCEERACSRSGGHFFLANQLVKDGDKPPTLTTNNIYIHTLCQSFKTVMYSAAESEFSATFPNAMDTVPIRTTLEELGHPQPPTNMQVDNTTSVGFANDTIKHKRFKTFDMRF